jgi:hypothetical protein
VNKFELGNDGKDARPTWGGFGMGVWPFSVSSGGGAALGRRKQRFKGVAARSVRLKKQRGIFGNVGLMRVLRFLSSKLDRILFGLFLKEGKGLL